jgi:hypothetical protein
MSTEPINKARDCAAMLASDIREAHKEAVRDGSQPALEFFLRDLIAQSVAIKTRMEEIANLHN